jgi:dihydrolipoamide dehydrogenase
LPNHGIKTGKVSLDLAAMMARKDKVVEELTDNVRKLLEGQRHRHLHGTARLKGAGRWPWPRKKGKRLPGQKPTPSCWPPAANGPVEIPGLEFDGKRIVSSTEALAFDTVPKHLGVVGGGYIGLELGSVWMRLGAKVTVIEMLPKIAATLDGQVGRTLDRILKKQGLEMRMKTRVVEAKVRQKGQGHPEKKASRRSMTV